MPHHPWIVIEGDDGTGKDTLACGLVGAGFAIINAHPLAVETLGTARTTARDGRHEAYMKLNEVCGDLARACDGPAALVRYWPSTIAAAYTDWDLDNGGLPALIEPALSLPQPDLFLCLVCDLPTRRERILLRGSVDGRLDDTTAARDNRYRYSIHWIAERFGRWVCINTSSLNPDQVVGQALAILQSMDLLP